MEKNNLKLNVSCTVIYIIWIVGKVHYPFEITLIVHECINLFEKSI